MSHSSSKDDDHLLYVATTMDDTTKTPQRRQNILEPFIVSSLGVPFREERVRTIHKLTHSRRI